VAQYRTAAVGAFGVPSVAKKAGNECPVLALSGHASAWALGWKIGYALALRVRLAIFHVGPAGRYVMVQNRMGA
jgi:hypothetical protein